MTSTNEGMTKMQKTYEGPKTPAVILRPSKLEKDGKIGLIASGVFEKKEANKFDPKKEDYFIRGADDTLYIINETSELKKLLGQDGAVGLFVEVHYNGKKPSRKVGGKAYHDWEVFARKA